MTKAQLSTYGMMALLGLSACRGEVSQDPPIVLIRNMYDQPRYNPQSVSGFFGDKRTMRAPVEGTVPRTGSADSVEATTGREADESGYVLTIPRDVMGRVGNSEAFLKRGQERYGIYCSPCHDKSGYGNGTVVQRGFLKPPSLHEARIREMPDGQLFATISNGVRNMPAYAAQISLEDRWAVVAYVRALELTQVSQMEPQK